MDGIPRPPVVNGVHPRAPSTGRRKNALGSLDLAILRECSGEGTADLGFDPRRSPEYIAKRLEVSPATVRRRLTMWRRRGFFLGYDVLPHPGLLGGRLAARMIEFPNPIAQERAIVSLSLIDGMIQIVPARTMLLAVYFVDSASQAERRLKQLQGAEGPREIGPEMFFEYPPCSHRMSRSDWRLVLALRRNPEASVGELAEEVGQSTRTTSRRLDSLLDEGAVIFDPIFEFSRFYQTLAVLVATVEPADRREEVERQIRALHPESFPTWGPTLPNPTQETAELSLWVSAPTTAELDELTARVAHLPAVNQVFLWYGRSTLPIRAWLNEQIETVLRLSDPAG
ncbi:MAG: winged helix-turn-helix domain-containing protein [Thermoplasmata archaeon]